MGDPLRDRCSLQELAKNKQVIEIANVIGDFERLAELVEADLAALDKADRPAAWRELAVSGELRFAFDGAHDSQPILEGEIATRVPARCQRCLGMFEHELETGLRLVLKESGKELPEREGYEQWELPDEQISPIDIADEALVMAMPLAARHADDADCAVTETDAGQDEREEMTTPFASLRAQMDDTN